MLTHFSCIQKGLRINLFSVLYFMQNISIYVVNLITFVVSLSAEPTHSDGNKTSSRYRHECRGESNNAAGISKLPQNRYAKCNNFNYSRFSNSRANSL